MDLEKRLGKILINRALRGRLAPRGVDRSLLSPAGSIGTGYALDKNDRTISEEVKSKITGDFLR